MLRPLPYKGFVLCYFEMPTCKALLLCEGVLEQTAERDGEERGLPDVGVCQEEDGGAAEETKSAMGRSREMFHEMHQTD